MDSPNVSINDLFADVRTSLQKYEARQKLAKQQREHKRRAKAAGGGKAIAKPLFASQLLINSKENSSSHVSSKVDQEDTFSAAGRTSVHKRRVSSLEPSTSETKENEDSDNDADIITTMKSVPEYIPLCERRRRAEAEAALCSKSSQLIKQKNGMSCFGATDTPNFKPLMWNKPSFTLGGESSSNNSTSAMVDMSSSSLSPRPGKRKAQEAEEKNDTTPFSRDTLLDDVNTITPLSRGQSMVYGRYYNPMHRRQWAKEEVDSLGDFADKWILTPDLKKQRTR